MKMFLKGKIPSKKNLLRRSQNSGMFRNSSIAAQIDALTLQARAAWQSRPSLVCQPISAVFIVSDMRCDIDNKWTTVLDCLVKAGVLKSDGYQEINRRFMAAWANVPLATLPVHGSKDVVEVGFPEVIVRAWRAK